MGKALPYLFYEKKTKEVAQGLIGKTLVRRLPDGRVLKCIITETEAYLGVEDRACHTFGWRNTERTKTMWGPAGYVYVYFIYGMYHCLNVVTRGPGIPEAVLIRGARPLESKQQIPIWTQIESDRKKWKNIMSGPGRLCRVLKIDKTLNGMSLRSKDIYIEDGIKISRKTILKTARIGIGYSGEAQHWPLRFVWNCGSLYERVFKYSQNNRKNTSGENATSRKKSRG